MADCQIREPHETAWIVRVEAQRQLNLCDALLRPVQEVEDLSEVRVRERVARIEPNCLAQLSHSLFRSLLVHAGNAQREMGVRVARIIRHRATCQRQRLGEGCPYIRHPSADGLKIQTQTQRRGGPRVSWIELQDPT